MPPRFDENTQTFYLDTNYGCRPLTATSAIPTTSTTTSTATPILNTYNDTITTIDNNIWKTPFSHENFITKYNNNYINNVIINVSVSNICNMDALFYDNYVYLTIKFSDIIEKEIAITIERNDPMFDYFMMLYSGWNEVQKNKSELKERENKINSFNTEDLNKDLSKFLKE